MSNSKGRRSSGNREVHLTFQHPTYPSGHSDPKIAAVMDVLQRWFVALEDGTAQLWVPDDRPRRNGKPLWTEEELDALIAGIDRLIDREIHRTPGTVVHADAGADFWRLAPAQRLALAQELDAALGMFDD